MPPSETKRHGPAYAGLDFIKAAFCPLEFNACKLKEHPEYAHLGSDEALGELEVSDPLSYPRQFPYTDPSGNRKTGTQIVTAHFGLAPKDFDLLLGLYTYLRRLPELPADGRTYLTADFIARQLNLPATCQKDYQRIRSRLFRLSYVKYTNTAFWNSASRRYDIANFGFFNLASLSRMTESRRPIVFEWDRTFLEFVRQGAMLTFDYDLYQTLSPALRRLYLIANRDGWNQQHSSLFNADDFAIHQIGYDQNPDRQKLRLQKLRKLLEGAEAIGLIRPYGPWNGYLQMMAQGPLSGKRALRWSRGTLLRKKEDANSPGIYTDHIENDALYAQVKELHDDEGHPCSPETFRRLATRFGRDRLQRQVLVVLAQKEHHPAAFTRSELAAFINRCQHDHSEPDWYQDLKRAERVAHFADVQPNQLSLDVYGTFFRE